MRILRASTLSLILIALTCSVLSCDSYGHGSLLYRVLRKLKFRVTEISVVYPAHLNRYDVLFLVDLEKSPTDAEIQEIQNFVNTGGTLIVAGDSRVSDNLFSAYGLELRELPKKLGFSRRIPEEPLFPRYPVGEVRTFTDFAIEPFGREVSELYGTDSDAVVVTLRDGQGRAFFIASTYLFSKDGLRYDGNSTLLYNLMSTLPRRAHIALAEKRYYTVDSKPLNPFTALVFKTTFGLGAVCICLMLFIFLLLRGRPFGKPLDVHDRSRRLSSEYVHAMTALYQKGDTRQEILKHLRDTFRADLGRRWQVNPTLDTPTFLETLAQRGALDADDQLPNLVTDLEPMGNLSEAALLDIAKRVETYREAVNLGKPRRYTTSLS